MLHIKSYTKILNWLWKNKKNIRFHFFSGMDCWLNNYNLLFFIFCCDCNISIGNCHISFGNCHISIDVKWCFLHFLLIIFLAAYLIRTHMGVVTSPVTIECLIGSYLSLMLIWHEEIVALGMCSKIWCYNACQHMETLVLH